MVLTIVLFGSGVELWLFGYRFGFGWRVVRLASLVFWLVALAVHVAFHLRRAPELAPADWRDHLQGALARRSLVVASLVVGAVLAIAMLPFATPFSFAPGA